MGTIISDLTNSFLLCLNEDRVMVSLQTFRKGFTLIELLIVVAVLGILAAIVLTAIDPVDKINTANDAKVSRDMASIASAAEAYAASNNGVYPTLAQLTSSGEMRSIPQPPSGYLGANCAANYGYPSGATAPVSFTLVCAQKAKRLGTTMEFRRYESTTGKMCNVATATTACP